MPVMAWPFQNPWAWPILLARARSKIREWVFANTLRGRPVIDGGGVCGMRRFGRHGALVEAIWHWPIAKCPWTGDRHIRPCLILTCWRLASCIEQGCLLSMVEIDSQKLKRPCARGPEVKHSRRPHSGTGFASAASSPAVTACQCQHCLSSVFWLP